MIETAVHGAAAAAAKFARGARRPIRDLEFVIGDELKFRRARLARRLAEWGQLKKEYVPRTEWALRRRPHPRSTPKSLSVSPAPPPPPPSLHPLSRSAEQIIRAERRGRTEER